MVSDEGVPSVIFTELPYRGVCKTALGCPAFNNSVDWSSYDQIVDWHTSICDLRSISLTTVIRNTFHHNKDFESFQIANDEIQPFIGGAVTNSNIHKDLARSSAVTAT